MTREEAVKLLQATRLMLMDGANQPISDLYYALDMAIEALEQTESNSGKPNNCEYAENPSGDVWECGCFLDTYCEHQIYDRNPDGTINIVECGYEPKDEPFDKDINVRSKDEPQNIELSKVKSELNEWRDIIGDDVVDDIISNLEEKADEDEP